MGYWLPTLRCTRLSFLQAILSGSEFEGAKIEGTDFTDALLDDKVRFRLCKVASGTNPKSGVSTSESLLCNLRGIPRMVALEESSDRRAEVEETPEAFSCDE